MDDTDRTPEQEAADNAGLQAEIATVDAPFDTDQLAALAILEHATSIQIEKAVDGTERWYVIDRSYAEPEVNWPGADLGGPFDLEKAIRVRKEAQADVLHRWRTGQPRRDPYGRDGD